MNGSTTTRQPLQDSRSDKDSLLRLSIQIGRNPLLAQASSGNTSLKLDGTLWIKASGKWLAHADREEILVPVPLSECLECLDHGMPLGEGESQWAKHLRPSIETFMHAVLPQRVVIHVHSVNTIAWAIRSDAPVQLSERLSGLRWEWIPYAFSGLPLARQIQAASSRCPNTDVFILGNHGLVVCAEDCSMAESLLFEVERRLAIRPRDVPKPKLSVLEHVERLSHWRLPDIEALHTLGMDVVSRRILRKGVLYPCQAIFLGRTLPVVPCSKPLSEVTGPNCQSEGASPFLIIEGCGVMIGEKITTAEYATLNGFMEVVRRIETSAPIRYLTDHELDGLLGSDAHHYRISADNSARLATPALRSC
jgi:rhamnose utilization protein RhaD (predicted bifunctional aldolase and dehydrogenase)